jgi:hypothetical protein
MPVYPKRVRYTHKAYLYKQINTVFSGNVATTMTVAGYPTSDFKLAITVSDICRIKVIGTLDGSAIIERLSFSTPGTQYTVNTFDSITNLTSSYFVGDTTAVIQAVDSVGMPLSWQQTYGPHSCEFGQMGGMSAQIEANALGLGSKLIHYVRIERSAPLSKDMTLSIVGYDDQIWVPISDFENISAPPNYVVQEWAFRVVKKQDGDT